MWDNLFTGWHLVIIVAVLVLMFGANRLPDAARSLGKSMRIFKSEIRELQHEGKPEDPPSPTLCSPSGSTRRLPTRSPPTPGRPEARLAGTIRRAPRRH